MLKYYVVWVLALGALADNTGVKVNNGVDDRTRDDNQELEDPSIVASRAAFKILTDAGILLKWVTNEGADFDNNTELPGCGYILSESANPTQVKWKLDMDGRAYVYCNEDEEATSLQMTVGQWQDFDIPATFFEALGEIEPLRILQMESFGFGKFTFGKIPDAVYGLTISQLELRRNELTDVDPKIGEMTNLILLRLEDNHIGTLPDEFTKLVNLSELWMDRNSLLELPEDIGNLKNLEYLSLTDNNLRALPASLVDCTNLVMLLASDNHLSELPAGMGNLKKLETLKVQNNELRSLPDDIGEMQFLQELNADNNRIETLPPSVGDLTRLTKLSLQNNNLQTLPTSIKSMSRLTSLDVGNNQIVLIPREISMMLEIQALAMNDNQLRSLPKAMEDMTTLSYLDVSNNELTMVPDLKNNAKLNTVNLLNNQLTCVPALPGDKSWGTEDDAFQMDNEDNFTEDPVDPQNPDDKIRECHTMQTEYDNDNSPSILVMKEAFKFLQEQTKLLFWTVDPINDSTIDIPDENKIAEYQGCYMSGGELTGLAREAYFGMNSQGEWKSSGMAYANCNDAKQVTSVVVMRRMKWETFKIPDAFFVELAKSEMESLRSLTIQMGAGEQDGGGAMSSKLWELTELTELDLSSNSLTIIPPEIAALENLEKLVLADNSIVTLPENIMTLSNLQHFDANHNRLQAIPYNPDNKDTMDRPFTWRKLRYFDVMNNAIENMDYDLNFWSFWNLSVMRIGANPMRTLSGNMVDTVFRLTEFNVHGTLGTAFPENFFSNAAISLEQLIAYDHKYTALPVDFVDLTALTTMDFTNGPLASLPDDIKDLTKLSVMKLSHNYLTAIPELPPNLQTLDLSYNEIVTVPENLQTLSSLFSLDLSNNKIKYVPQLHDMHDLYEAHLHNNPMECTPVLWTCKSWSTNQQADFSVDDPSMGPCGDFACNESYKPTSQPTKQNLELISRSPTGSPTTEDEFEIIPTPKPTNAPGQKKESQAARIGFSIVISVCTIFAIARLY